MKVLGHRIFSILLLFLIFIPGKGDTVPVQQGEKPGHILFPNGQVNHINTALCQIALVNLDRRRFRAFNDFFNAGGEGEILELSTTIEDFKRGYDYAKHLEITKLPTTPSPSSSILWLRDPVTLAKVQRILSEGPLFFRDLPTSPYNAAILLGRSSLAQGMLIHRLDSRYQELPITVLTQDADEFIIAHERQHFEDELGQSGFKTSRMTEEANKLMQQTNFLLAGVNPFLDIRSVIEFILEQRADVARIKEMRDALGFRRKIMVRKEGTKTKVEEISFSVYFKTQIKRCRRDRLGHENGLYGKPFYELLRKINRTHSVEARVLRAFVAENLLPSHDIGMDQIIPQLD